jgi:carbamoyltransferase
MKPNEHEYKVMGLSSYSNSERHIKNAEAVFFDALDFRDGAFVSDKPLSDSYFDLRDRLEGHRFDNISAAVQNWSTELTRAWMQHWLQVTGCEGVCFSGGLSMNIKMNGLLLDIPELKWLSIPASGGDESLSAGACFAKQATSQKTIVPLQHVYLGSEPDFDDWHIRLDDTDLSTNDFVVIDNVNATAVAFLLAADEIVARCVGHAEFGARSLGNRTILANPSNPENLKKINDTIKNRDFWMPFTPSILEEHTDRYIVNPKSVSSPYMTIGFSTKPAAWVEIPAALHPADKSARPQFVFRETNEDYWMIIECFRQATGIPAILNTSLNLHGDPMNYDICDAVRTLALSKLELLLVPGNRLICKKVAEPRIRTLLTQA